MLALAFTLDLPSLLAGVGLACGGLSLYIRLTLSDFIVKTLNGRYPTTDLFKAEMARIHTIVAELPCKNGHGCDAHSELWNARQALESAVMEIVAIKKGFNRQ